MSSSRLSATTTYPFRVTTYVNPSPVSAASYPTTYTDTTWLPPVSADTQCASAAAYPSVSGPSGLQAACVISNAADINPNAFWDVYECCPGHDISSYGYAVTGGEISNSGICMMQCTVGEGSTWQQVGECLQKRVKEVVCAPEYEERIPYASLRSTTSAGVTVSATRPGGDGASSATGAASTGAAASVDVVHASSSKLALIAFGLLALGSAAGMFL